MENLTIQDLKEIITGLKISGLSHVENDDLDEIKGMIKSLPSSEKVDEMAENKNSLDKLKSHIGGIMRLIELYSKRNGEYKTRYKSRTNLPPRYKVMDFQSKAKTIKEIIRISSKIDENGDGELSSSLITLAKSI
jgi:hypothetical protein